MRLGSLYGHRIELNLFFPPSLPKILERVVKSAATIPFLGVRGYDISPPRLFLPKNAT